MAKAFCTCKDWTYGPYFGLFFKKTKRNTYVFVHFPCSKPSKDTWYNWLERCEVCWIQFSAPWLSLCASCASEEGATQGGWAWGRRENRLWRRKSLDLPPPA